VLAAGLIFYLRFPGLHCPGLIEASQCTARRVLPHSRFPGLHCPGLIEAFLALVCVEAIGQAFRGFIAPASLKPGQYYLHHKFLRRFPGLHCPGLIEAFIYFNARDMEGSFPGLHCPGLIEAKKMILSPLTYCSFPGLHCPGLIEAYLIQWCLG